MSGETSDQTSPSALFLYLTLMSVLERWVTSSRSDQSVSSRRQTLDRAETILVSRCSGGRRCGRGAVDCSVT